MTFDSKQQQILDAAKALFGEKGYEATSVRDIAELAESNVASINYYFGSKEELFKTICDTCLKSTHKIISVLKEEPESIEGLKMILRNFFKLFLQLRHKELGTHDFLHRNIDLFIKLSPETFKRDIWVVVESLTSLLKKAKKRKLLKKEIDPEIFATVLFSGLGYLFRDGKVHCTFWTHQPFDDEFKNQYINQVINGFIDGAKENA